MTLCKECGVLLEGRDRKKFCSKSHAASYNNRITKVKPKGHCLYCNSEIPAVRKYCSAQCQRDLEYVTYIKRWHVGEEDGNKGKHKSAVSNYVRRWLFEQQGPKCWVCGWDSLNPWTENCPVEVNHIDGDWLNTVPDNLELICPNCHSLTEHHGSRNTGRGRRSVHEGKR